MGPVLFIILNNEIVTIVPYVNIFLFDDDTIIFLTDRDSVLAVHSTKTVLSNLEL